MKNFSIAYKDKSILLNKPKVMGILNITPDSFYSKSRCNSVDYALYKAEKMLKDGADILDVGGESTSKMVKNFGCPDDKDSFISEKTSTDQQRTATPQQELDRVIPVIDAIKKRFNCIISVDTSAPIVMHEAAQYGASIINDVRALNIEGAIDVVAKLKIPVILMHSLVEYPPEGFEPSYTNVVTTVIDYLAKRMEVCIKAGIPKDKIILDPGFGGGLFGKKPIHDHSLIKNIDKFNCLDRPVLVGVSRKSAIGAVINKPPEKRLSGSLALGLLAVQKGARILRVHNVEETVDMLKMLEAIQVAI
jgi:dihydropteroate synthase